MSIVISKISFSNEFRPETTDWLLGCIGEKIAIEIEFYVIEYYITAADAGVDEIHFVPVGQVTGLPFGVDVVYTEIQNGFANFFVGDTITFANATNPANNGTFRVKQQINSQTLLLEDATTGGTTGIVPERPAPSGCYYFNSTPITGLRYFYNFIENADPTTFVSYIDGETQRLEIANADAFDLVTNKPLTFKGNKGYQIGSANVIGLTTGAAPVDRQIFKLLHETFITPLFLVNQLTDLQARVAPVYYKNGASLKYVAALDAGSTLNNPNNIQTLQYDGQQGNVAWFNENFNGGASNYFVDSLVITRVSDSAVLNQLELGSECLMTIRIKNTVDSPFSNSNTKYVANMCYLPNNASEYNNNTQTQKQNFFFDRGLNTVGAGAINGDNFGGNYQMLKVIDSTFISASEIEVRLNVDLSSFAKSYIGGQPLKNYMVWVTTQNHTLATKDADKVALLIDVNEFFVQLFQTNLISASTVFIQHPYTSKTDGVSVPEIFPVDDIVAYTDFNIDFTGLQNDGIKILSVTNQIVLKNPTEADIILETDTIDTSAVPLVGLVQNFNFAIDRVFKIPSGEIRKVNTLKRDFSLDAGNTYNWYSSYPFMHRWEYWKPLTLNNIPPSLFDPLEPNNGINHFWHRYTTKSGWTINHRIKFVIEQNGQLFEQSFDNAMNSHDYLENPDWTLEKIESFDVASGLPLQSGSNKFVQGYVDSNIVATFEFSGAGTPPTLGDIDIVLWIETKESGGIDDIRRSSSVYNKSSNSWFTPLKTTVNVVGTTYTGTALLDHTKLPNVSEFTIYARLYQRPVVVDVKLTQSGIAKETQLGNLKEIN